MKKALAILFVLSASLGFAQGPGGVGSDLNLWLKGNVGTSTTSPGNGIQIWADQTGNGHNAYQNTSSRRPLYRNDWNTNGYADHQTNLRFFQIDNHADLNLTSSRTEYSLVVAFRTGLDVDVRQMLYEQGGTVRGFNFYIYNGEFYWGAWNTRNDGAGSPWAYKSFSTPIEASSEHVAALVFEGNDAITGTISCYLDGELAGTINNVGRMYAHSGNVGLGAKVNDSYFETGASSGTGNDFEGHVSEFAVYGDALTPSEVQDIATYMNVKWGIHIDQSAHDFYTYSSYNNNIAGIGADVATQELDQDDGETAIGELLRMNNPSSLDDGDYLVWGQDGGDIDTTNQGLFPGYSARMERVWRIRETGDVGTVDVMFDLSYSNFTSYSVLDFALLRDPSDDDFSVGATATPASTFDGTTVTFSGINFSTGDRFTLAMPPEQPTPSPGGIDDDLQIWLRADKSTSTQTEGVAVSAWNDQTSFNHDASQSSSGERPLYGADTFSYMPSLVFDGANDLLEIANSDFINLTSFRTEMSFTTTFSTGSNITSRQVLYEQGGGSRGLNIYIFNGDLYCGAWNVPNDGTGSPWTFKSVSGAVETNTEYILTFIYDGNDGATGTLSAFLNGVSIGTTSGCGRLYAHSGGISLGGTGGTLFEVGSSSAVSLDGRIAEFANYGDALNSSERENIELYFNIKYGVHIPNASHLYYNNGFTGHENGITGIGQNTIAWDLTKTQSKSMDAGSILSIGSATDLDESEYLVWGNDGGASTTTTTTGAHPSYEERIERIWRITETGDVGNVTVSIDLSKYNYQFKSASDFAILVDPTNSDFSTGATAYAATSFDGSTATFAGVHLSTGDYVAVGVPEEGETPGPGGVYDSLIVWLRADLGATSNVEGNAVSTWADQTTYGHDALQATGSNQPLFGADTFNVDPFIDFERTNSHFLGITNSSLINTGADRLELSFSMVFRTGNNVAATQILYEQGGSSRGLNMYISGGQIYYGGWNINSDGAGSPWSFRSVNSPVLPNHEYIATFVMAGNDGITGTIECYLNGELVGTVTGVGRLYPHAGNIGIGAMNNDSYLHTGSTSGEGHYLRGQVAEFLMFGKAIDSQERQDLETYLSMKYGVSVPADVHGFYDDAYTDYDNQLAGLGLNLDQFIDQTESRNETDSSIVSMSGATSLDAMDFLVWGNDGAELCNNTDVPGSLNVRLTRVWRVTETNEVGNVDVSVDLAGILNGSASNVRLLIDNDGTFSNASIVNMTGSSGDVVTFSNVGFNDGQYFSIATSDDFTNPNPPSVFTWVGAIDSDWDTPFNWGGCGVPTTTDTIIISNSGSTLTLTQNRGAAKVTLDNGAVINLAGFDFDLTGDWINNGGTVIHGGSGKLSLNGSGVQTFSGTGTSDFEDVDVANSSGVVISSGILGVHGSLEVVSGDITTGGNLTLRSDATGTGRIGVIGATDIVGDVNVERYLIQSQRQWRYMGTPFSDCPVSDWQTNFPVTGTFTGASTGPGLTNNYSLFWYDETLPGSQVLSDYTKYPVSANTELLQPGQGYAVYVRDESNLTFSSTGTIHQGNFTYNITYNETGTADGWGWNLISNPYPSPIQWATADWSRVAIDNAIYFTDNENGMNVAYVNGISVPFGACNGIIPSHQAFWVHANSATASLFSSEDVKTDSDPTRFYRTEAPVDQLFFEFTNLSTQEKDQTVFYLEDNATTGFDGSFDAYKLLSGNTAISSFTSDDEEVVINAYPNQLYDTARIKFQIVTNVLSACRIDFINNQSLSGANDYWLHDLLTDEYINIAENDFYEFTISSASEQGDSRFELVINEHELITSTPTESAFSYAVYPNPVHDGIIQVTTEGEVDEYIYRLIDSQGKEVLTGSSPGEYFFVIPIPESVDAGIYHLHLSDGSTSSVEKIFIR